MTHCTMDQLLAARDGDATQATQAHLAACAACQAEYDQLAQRIAALRALPAGRPPRDRWPAVRRQLAAARRRRFALRGGAGLALVAASLLLAVTVRDADLPPAAAAPDEVAVLQEQSQQLEGMLAAYGTQGRVVDGRTAAVIADLEDRIALVDAGIVQARAANAPVRDMNDLWRGRVELMGALVNAHVTRASYVGF